MAKQNTVFKDAFNRCLTLIAETEALPSELELGTSLGVSRTTVRAILARLKELEIIAWDKRTKAMLRAPQPSDFFSAEETSSLAEIIERSFMRRILAGGAEPGMQINELELARDIGTGTTSVREFLIRFSRFGLIEKRPNSHWVLKGFTRDFALELTEIREMFELRSAAGFAALPGDHPAWRDLDEMEVLHRDMLANIDTRYRDFSELDERFHLLVHRSSSNRFIIDFYDIITIVFHYHYQWNKANDRERNARAVEEHLDYIAALKTRDPATVAHACRQHLRSARETLLQSIQQPDA
ncbi:GntR family transcriptional regulator [Rhizobium sp. DKSPLA3]|uniref:GntR family transcriptional regulator n=1 Tax=Rhizobium quercicola TaxID=2901226 RepID=A0A9X1NRI3_9HYPH|nr:GntR family transcriptional regulator [Rhizobium quercicola]MCD7108003.1 GntR family transcriptional regulator [Rhizobium quercicola]